ncbi:MAG TPA: UDP-N-acetylglucosamine 2-epimerase (non-hydrolyzing) [Candidatus Acidoferrales bacterium]|nr:UDP-N-acetylglucosamine 2-epimerase (non-hydrolyzing) [Candidatus Acidoferrales bacterium]
MKIVTILGARPQFVKAKPVSNAFEQFSQAHHQNGHRIREVMIHTGQHYDRQMSDVFFSTLSLKEPEYNLGVGSGAQGWQTAEILKGAEEVLEREKPDAIIVYGDTNSTLGGALAGAKLQIPVAHVEAGLRSFRRGMPEEINRVLTDHLSSLLFAPTATAVKNLNAEGITRNVYLVGDVMQEVAFQFLQVARQKSTILKQLKLCPQSYSLVTVHRAENTDNPQHLRGIVQALKEIGKTETLVWPLHPRTSKKLKEFHLDFTDRDGVTLIEPLSYLDMLALESSSNVVLTDSGGVQKEAVWFEVPCITLREETEWIETIESGRNHLAGTRTETIVELFQAAKEMKPNSISASADVPKTSAASAIVNAIAEWHHASGKPA